MEVLVPGVPERVSTESGEIAYQTVRSRRRRKTVMITVGPEGVRVAAPLRTTADEVQQIVVRRSAWIERRLAELPDRRPPRAWHTGESIPYLGRSLALEFRPVAGRRIMLRSQDSRLILSEPTDLDSSQRGNLLERLISRWLRDQANAYFADRVRKWSEQVGAEPAAVRVRNQKRRWGSCSADGTLRFNWRLIMAPPDLVDYVVVHELAHLKVRNHSAAFWAEVERVLPDYRTRRQALAQIGPTLTL